MRKQTFFMNGRKTVANVKQTGMCMKGLIWPFTIAMVTKMADKWASNREIVVLDQI